MDIDSAPSWPGLLARQNWTSPEQTFSKLPDYLLTMTKASGVEEPKANKLLSTADAMIGRPKSTDELFGVVTLRVPVVAA